MTERSGALDRRTIAKGAAWAVPAVTIAAAAPSLAASVPVRKDPGVNGWVANTARPSGECSWTLEVDSTATGATPDGAPYGLYLYDITPESTVADAALIYWIIGEQSATWANLSGHSTCWSGPTRGEAQKKSDGLLYTPYTWKYNCPILADEVKSDGRLYLGGFHVRGSFTQSRDYCNDVTYWTQRSVIVDPDGAGSQAAQTLTFERRNGTRGPATSAQIGARSRSATVSGESAQLT